MKNTSRFTGVILLVLLVVAGLAWAGYNRLVGLHEGVDAAWSQVENVYQRRADLIPNLIKTVEAARDFERETLQKIVEIRAQAGRSSTDGVPTAEQMRRFDSNQAQLGSALARLLVVVENYPDLKATAAFRDLQSQLEGAENRITVERRRFNDSAREYNTARRRFPTNLLASYFDFAKVPYFESAPGTHKPPTIEFSQ